MQSDEIARRRGIYRTSLPLVRYVVRSTDYFLRKRLGRAEGIRHQDVRLLDPAAGAMNFVIEACRLAIEHEEGAVGVLASEHLCPHFAGIEVVSEEHTRGVTAIRKFLKSRGVGDRTIPLYLADALAGPQGPWNLVKGARIAVVLGNPPWRGHSANRGSWIESLLRSYQLPDGRRDEGYFQVNGKTLGERNLKWLADDYVKFLRVAQWAVDRAGTGIVAFVVNHTCLDAPIFRGLRWSLLQTFDEIYALDLHGNRRRKECAPDGAPDEGVFSGVAQGAAVLLLVKGGPNLPKRVFRADLYGTRKEKLQILEKEDAGSTPWTEIRPQAPSYLFVATDALIESEFRKGLSLPEICPVYTPGVITGKDALFTGIDRHALEEKIVSSHQFGKAVEVHGGELPVTGFLTRPFDVRFLLYVDRLLERPRVAVMDHMRDGANLGLVVSRQSKEGFGAIVSRYIVGHKVVSTFDTNSLFPLYLRSGRKRIPNLAPGPWRQLGERYGVLPEPEEVLGYVYAVLYSPAYRKRYREPLRREFPRIIFPNEYGSFAGMAQLGRILMNLHLLEDQQLARTPVRLEGDAREPLDPLSAAYREERVYLNSRGLSFVGIGPEVWKYRIGAYQVLSRWLWARKGRVLAWNECRIFRQIAEALRRTITVQEQIGDTGA